MNVGERVKIKSPNKLWDNKEGILETINENECIVFVDFIPEEGKKIRQNFTLDCILPLDPVNNVTESKKFNPRAKTGSESQSELNLSSLYELSKVIDKKDFSLFTNYPYSFNVYVSSTFINGLNSLRRSILSSNKILIFFYRRLNFILSNLSNRGVFNGVSTEKINGLPQKYSGKIRELRIGDIQGKPVRVLYFISGKNIILGNIFYHKESNLTSQERNSINDIYDEVVIK